MIRNAGLNQIIADQVNGGVIRHLLRAAIFKKAVDPSYNLGTESRLYNEYLGRHNIYVRHSFTDYFMDMMTGKDPTVRNLGIHGADKILDDHGNFVSDDVRRLVAQTGRACRMLGPGRH